MIAFRSSAVRSVSSLALTLCLLRVEDFVELLLVDVQRHFAEHLDEAAVAVVGEARVAGLGHQALDGFVVQAEVEDGVHHAGHGELRAGAHAEQQRVRGVAELLAEVFSSFASALPDLLVDLGRERCCSFSKIDVADFRRDGEAGRNRHAGAAHFGQAGAFAAQRILHLSVAVGRSAAETYRRISSSMLLFSSYELVTISEKSAIVENSASKVLQAASTGSAGSPRPAR